jgi:hypothetical protein
MNDPKCVELARYFLRDYRLKQNERIDETARLAEAFKQVADLHLENLEHLKVTR